MFTPTNVTLDRVEAGSYPSEAELEALWAELMADEQATFPTEEELEAQFQDLLLAEAISEAVGQALDTLFAITDTLAAA